MTLARILPWAVAKEVRALRPLWLGCLALMFAGVAPGDERLRALVVILYCAGSVALGVLSIGHEYSHGTLPLLLAQPVSRARLFMVKLLVRAVMVLTLAAAAWSTVFYPSSGSAMVVTLAVLGGLFVAPWLTMLSRNPLAGLVFTVGIPGMLWVLIDGLFADPLVVFRRLILAISAVAAVLGWRTFMRLEAIEGRGQDLRLAMTRADGAPGRPRHPLWLLAKKELALQQLSIVVAGIASLCWLAIFLLGVVTTSRRAFEDPIGVMTFLYSGMLAMVIGSLASAEERQLGTLEWQVLLPMASWKQWAVKAGTTLGLSLLLAVALPELLRFPSGGPIRINEWYACAILLLTVVSLYVSSLSRSGVKALLLSLPVTLLVLFPVMALLTRMGRIDLTPLTMGLFAVMLAVVLYFALLNHRSDERGAWRICVQVFCIAGCLASCTALVGVFAVR